ncbi:MAG TPA: hypothetical protein VJ487_07580 [Alphaproteobacteria bacterium]|nr:hypothetical protein [Alphaproteobacteria bacterium]
MPYRTVLLAAVVACLAVVAAAQTAPPPVRIRGTIAALDDKSIAIATREGPTVTIALGEKFTVSAVKATDISEIKAGTFIGTAAEAGAGGMLQALEVVVFPESMRGTGEGHYDWDLKPGSTMTNATVSAVVEGVSGRDLELAYKGGSTKVRVPANVPIVTIVPAERADLKAGLPAFAVASRGSDGTLTLLRINVGKYGVAPPM